MPIDFTAGATTFKNVNNGVLGDNYDDVMRLSNSLNKIRNFGKAWDVGDSATVFYPFKWYPNEAEEKGGVFKPHIAAYYGHHVSDYDAFGTIFLRSTSIIDENGEVVGDGDLAYQASKIAPLFVQAKKEKEIKELNDKDMSELSKSAWQSAYDRIRDRYDPKKNKDAVRPFIDRLSILKIAEVVFVLMDPNKHTAIFNDDKDRKTGRYIQTMSDARLNKLKSLANDVHVGILAQNPNLVPEPGTIYFLEVSYNYTSSNGSKTEAGRNDPQGVGETATILFTTPENKENLLELQKRIPETASGILQHTYNMSPMPDAVLLTKMQSVVFESLTDLQFLQEADKERLVKSAKFFDTIRLSPKPDNELVEKMEKELGHKIGASTQSEDAPTLQSIIQDDGTPDFSMQSQAVLDTTETELEEMQELLGGM